MNVIAQAQFKTGARRYDMTEAERKIRIEAAAAFRIAHHYSWNLQINNHICVRLPDRPDHFLMNPLRARLGRDHRLQSRDIRWTARRRDRQPRRHRARPGRA